VPGTPFGVRGGGLSSLARASAFQIGGTIYAGIGSFDPSLSGAIFVNGDSLPVVHPCPTLTPVHRTCGL
jgi:hypothetical protein